MSISERPVQTAALATSPAGAAPRGHIMLLVVGPQADADTLSEQFVDHAIDVMACDDSAHGLLQAGRHRPDAVLVAAAAPGVDSVTFVRVLCESTGIPVLVGVGADDGDHAAKGLAAGATACVARPYRAREVLRLVRGLRPDTMALLDPPVRAGGLLLDPATFEVQLYGRRVVLPPREFRLLQLLMAHANRIVTREQIRATVWSASERDASNTITVHVQRLRGRLGDDPHKPAIIHTVRRVGYRLVPPPARGLSQPAAGR